MNKNILRLDQVLKEKNVKQKDLAFRLNISKQSICYWVNNRNLPSVETLSLIAKELNVNIKDLFV
ncbi:helix-turn-helix transcriptional regulator [Flavobacterium sp.]|jgi:transcriptional regulator with XRE-family HTH domain|uniref:helix-turn-helix transcriptional regulator n=1 Tax=Flavobacterium sp. TaxID=239 RepID=UPI0038F5E657